VGALRKNDRKNQAHGALCARMVGKIKPMGRFAQECEIDGALRTRKYELW